MIQQHLGLLASSCSSQLVGCGMLRLYIDTLDGAVQHAAQQQRGPREVYAAAASLSHLLRYGNADTCEWWVLARGAWGSVLPTRRVEQAHTCAGLVGHQRRASVCCLLARALKHNRVCLWATYSPVAALGGLACLSAQRGGWKRCWPLPPAGLLFWRRCTPTQVRIPAVERVAGAAFLAGKQ